MKTHFSAKYFILLLILGAIWGSSFILMKIGLRGMQPMELASWRNAAALITSLPFVIPAIRNIPVKDWGYVFIAAMFGNGIPAVLYAIASTKVDSGVSGVLNALTPLFTLTFGVYLFRNNSLKNKWKGVLIGLAGAVVLILSSQAGAGKTDINFIALPVIAAACYGISVNTVKTYLSHHNTFYVTSMLYVFLGTIGFSILAALHSWESVSWNTLQGPFWQVQQDASTQRTASFIAIFVLGSLGTAIANFGFYYLMQKTSVLFGSMTTYIIPIVALFWGFVYGEQITWIHLVSIALICLGIWEVSRTRK